jgi:hypothetical protein
VGGRFRVGPGLDGLAGERGGDAVRGGEILIVEVDDEDAIVGLGLSWFLSQVSPVATEQSCMSLHRLGFT